MQPPVSMSLLAGPAFLVGIDRGGISHTLKIFGHYWSQGGGLSTWCKLEPSQHRLASAISMSPYLRFHRWKSSTANTTTV